MQNIKLNRNNSNWERYAENPMKTILREKLYIHVSLCCHVSLKNTL